MVCGFLSRFFIVHRDDLVAGHSCGIVWFIISNQSEAGSSSWQTPDAHFGFARDWQISS